MLDRISLRAEMRLVLCGAMAEAKAVKGPEKDDLRGGEPRSRSPSDGDNEGDSCEGE
jgi:hypothetical protein